MGNSSNSREAALAPLVEHEDDCTIQPDLPRVRALIKNRQPYEELRIHIDKCNCKRRADCEKVLTRGIKEHRTAMGIAKGFN